MQTHNIHNADSRDLKIRYEEYRIFGHTKHFLQDHPFILDRLSIKFVHNTLCYDSHYSRSNHASVFTHDEEDRQVSRRK